tara:strand:- start:362 stop:667 length:306 start_codon:yes stop_codon:yes gene_type:complete
MGVAVFIGAFVGFSSQLLANSLRQIPLTSAPWIHVGGAVAGGLVGKYYEEKMPYIKEYVRKDREQRGLENPDPKHFPWMSKSYLNETEQPVPPPRRNPQKM